MKIRLLIALILIASFSVAQEKLTVDEITRWFPEGKYSHLEHVDIENAEKADNYFEYLNNRGGSRSRISQSLRIPDFLSYQWSSFTRMSTSKTSVFSSGEKVPDKYKMIARFPVDGKTYTAISSGAELSVLRFPVDYNLSRAIKRSIHLEKSDQIVAGQALWKYETTNMRQAKYTFFLFVTENNNLLICEDLNYLKKMVAAGRGEIMNVVLEDHFPGLSDLIPDLSHHWSFHGGADLMQAILDRAEKERADNEEVTKLAENTKGINLSGSEHVIGDPYKRRNFTFCDSEEEANKLLEQIKKTAVARAKTDFDQQKMKSTTREVMGNIYISTLTYTPAFDKAFDVQSKVWRKETLDRMSKEERKEYEDAMAKYRKANKEKMK